MPNLDPRPTLETPNHDRTLWLEEIKDARALAVVMSKASLLKRAVIRLALALLVVLPASAAMSGQQSDLAAMPPPGRLVQIEGRQIHIHCTGVGSPTVLLEEGLGGASLNWAWVQRGVTKVSRVCSYDRPGYGWSDPSDAPMDAVNTSRQLYALLQAANEKGPYIAV